MAKLWRWLTEPAASIQRAEDRRRARLLSSLLVVLLPLFFIPEAIRSIVSGDTVPYLAMAMVLLIVSYGLSRTRRYTLATFLTLAAFTLIPIVGIVAQPDYHPEDLLKFLIWVIPTVVLGSLLLPPRNIVILIAANAAVGLSLPLLVPAITFGHLAYPYGFLTIVFALLLVAALVRQQDLQQLETQTRDLAAIADERRLFSRAVEQSASTIVITDLEGDIEYANPAFTRITGYSRQEAIGQNPRILKSGKHPPEMYKDLWATISSGGVWQGEMINKKKNGEFYWEFATISPVVDDNGQISHYLAVKEDITARKRVEAALQASEERYRSVTQSAHDAIISADSQGRVVSWNGGAQSIFGYREEEVLGQPLGLLIPAQYTDPHRQALARLRSGGLSHLVGQTVELEGRRQDGEVFPLEISLSSWQAGGEMFFGAILRDITSRKRIEEKLRRSEYRFRHLFEAAPDGAIVLDGEGLIAECNTSALRLLMRPAKEIVGRHIIEFMTPSSVHVFQDAFPILKQGKPAEEEIQLVRGDGSLLTVWRKGSPLTDAAGNMSGVLILDRDITERKQAEEELDIKRRQAETLRAATQALSSTLDLPQVFELILSELQKVVPYDSVSIQQLKGHELEIIGCRGFSNPAEIMGISFNLMEQDNPNRQVIETRAPLILHDPASDYPEFKAKRHAPARIASWLGVPLLFGDKPIGMIAVDKRETGFYTREHARLAMSFAAQAAIAIENAHLLAETQRARETALEASRLKTQLLANVSHDMRTPLGVILGRAEMLQGGVYGPLAEQQRTALTGIIDNTEQALTFVNNLLGQAQIESGKVAFNIKDFAPAELLDVIRSAASALAQAKGLELTGTVTPDMPATLRGDPYWLRQILANLVSNAVKFTEQGRVDVRICLADEGRWAMQVSDTGCGIPPGARAYIFEPFRQVDGTATRQQHTGSGLGLSIVRELTTLMGGEVELSSEVDKGSTFTVLLPFEPKEEKTS